MSAKLLNSLTDENPNAQKPIGCMNGLFHHFLAGRRGVGGRNHKTLPPGQDAKDGMEPNSTTEKAMEKSLDVVKEKQRAPAESSSTSFSSTSCSSTFSSVDCNRTTHPEPSSSGQSISPETPSQNITIKPPNSSLHAGRQSSDLRDIVKDSINREARGLSVKTASKEEGVSHVMKHVDSPRPSQLCKSVKAKVSSPDGSFRVLAKLGEAPRNPSKEKDGSLSSTPKVARRFSCDGRESRDTLKSNIRLKELPRLSLDSKAGSVRSPASESRSNSLLGDIQPGNWTPNKSLNPHQEPGSNERQSSIVVKLMGLEAFSDSKSTNEGQIRETKSSPGENFETNSRSSKMANEGKQSQVSGSPRVLQRNPASPLSRNGNSVLKPTSRFPLEPAPWRQPEGNRGSQKPAFMYFEAPVKVPNPSSVYGEIEKRFTGLEFKKSGKDLRALKQILEAMQKTRERREREKEEPTSSFVPQTSNNSLDQSSITTQRSQQSNHPISAAIRGTSPPKRFESSIAIIKPARLAEKPRSIGSYAIPIDRPSGLRKLRIAETADSRNILNDKQTAKDPPLRNNHLRDPSSQPMCSMNKTTSPRTSRSMRTSEAIQHMNMMEGNPTSSGRSSGTESPRQQQKKQGKEKLSCPSTPPSDSNRARRQSSKPPIESGSPSRKLKFKSPCLQQSDDQLSEITTDMRNLCHQGDTVSVQSESNIILATQIDTEVTSTDHSNEINGTSEQRDKKYKNLAAKLREDKSVAELATANLEQPSPVSVLDATFYREDSPSPVKKTSNAFKDDVNLYPYEAEWIAVDLDHLVNSTRPNFSSEFGHKKLEDVKHLVHKLERLNSTHDEATIDYIASICENTNPDHKYITEILLASGLLLKDLGSSLTITLFRPSSHLINPDLFLVLEQTRGSTELPNDEHSNEKNTWTKSNDKIQRKLVFDTVNELLVQKLTPPAPSEVWISPNKLKGRIPSGQKLLKELCSEIDQLQAYSEDDYLISILSGDMMHQSENWEDYRGDVPGFALAIERLIFKDLITEVVSGDMAGMRHCRQLFSK
ncbi:protein LONGIFOLIA 2-like [Cornus florida]|uniref:protein LONGIFOLIA 2-like n=1 Tax=Cornus florida TaxID=4283 RepID=UPI00289EA41E|nr:protein LONGIFOLIA 2-like [Cornus florida]